MRRLLTVCLAFCLTVIAVFSWSSVSRSSAQFASTHIAIGTGGAVASVDAIATQIGIDILKSGGNAVDAAVATAAGASSRPSKVMTFAACSDAPSD